MAPRILIYALGGGLGHLQRSLALARRAAQRGHHPHIITNSPWADPIQRSPYFPHQVDLSLIPPTLDRDHVIQTVTNILQQTPFDALVVDTFPRGLAGELAPILPRLHLPRILVHRDLTPAYANKPEVKRAAAYYDLILLPGEPAPLADLHPERTHATAPWLLLDPHELATPPQARAELGLSPDDLRPLVLVLGTGTPQEASDAAKLAAHLASVETVAISFASLEPELHGPLHTVSTWPLLRLMPGIDLLIGAGGYNTVHETRMTGTPLWAYPQKRLYDRQNTRITPAERIPPLDELPLRIAQIERLTRTEPTYTSGTHEAIQHIENLLA